MILAIDLGLAKLGYAIFNESNLIKYGTIKTKSKEPIEQRIKKIYNSINKLVKKNKIDVIAAEKFFPHSFTAKNLSILYIYGIVLLIASKKSIKLYDYNPKDIMKFITGYGNADKNQVQKMLKNIYKINLPKQKDLTDAIAIALYHNHTQRLRKCYPS